MKNFHILFKRVWSLVLVVLWVSNVVLQSSAFAASADIGSAGRPTDAAWQIEAVVEVRPDAFVSLALDSQGWPHVAYEDRGHPDIGYNSGVWYGYQDADGWHHQMISMFAMDVVMTLDSADRPHVAYYGYHTPAKCTGICYARFDGAGWQHSPVDWLGRRVFDLALDSNNRPYISYYNAVDERKIMYAERLADGSWTTEKVVVVGEGELVAYSAVPLALNRSGQPFIAFHRYGTQPTLLSRNGSAWQAEPIEQGFAHGLTYIDLAIGADGRPHVGYEYWTNQARYAHRDDGGWHADVLHTSLATGRGMALTLDAVGRPHLSYCKIPLFGQPGELRYSYYDGMAWQHEVVTSGVRCERTAITVDTGGRAHIAWADQNDSLLKIATRQAGDLVRITPTTGGVFTYTDPQGKNTVINVPSGAVAATTDLLYTPLSAMASPAGFAFAGHAFALEAYRDGVLQPAFAFAQPINITIHYSLEDVAVVTDPTALTLMYWNGATWVDAATTCTPRSVYDRHPDWQWLSVPVCHLSRFALFGPTHAIHLPLALHSASTGGR